MPRRTITAIEFKAVRLQIVGATTGPLLRQDDGFGPAVERGDLRLYGTAARRC